MKCSCCGKEISLVLYAFTVSRYGVPYCYAHLKVSNKERAQIIQQLKKK